MSAPINRPINRRVSLRASGRTNRRLRAHEVFAAPLLIALSTLAGLVLGLLGDGAWDIAAAVLVALPVLAVIVLRLIGRA